MYDHDQPFILSSTATTTLLQLSPYLHWTYNTTQWLNDTPHTVRQLSCIALSALLMITASVIFPLVFYRSLYYQPLKAQGLFFQCWKYMSLLYSIGFYSFFGIMNRMFIGMFLIFGAFFYIAPTLYRCWTIYFTLESTRLKMKMMLQVPQNNDIHCQQQNFSLQQNSSSSCNNDSTSSVLLQQIHRTNFYISLKFGLLIITILAGIHIILLLPCIPMYLFPYNDTYVLLYGGIGIVLSGLVLITIQTILYVKIRQHKIKDNYNILLGITRNIILQFAMIGILGVYVVLHAIIGFVDYDSVGQHVYYCLLPMDYSFMIIVFIDYFLYVYKNAVQTCIIRFVSYALIPVLLLLLSDFSAERHQYH